ncbi:type III-B CRISPR-associated protein Cas10/Cmr2 [Egbenema bharatensis]|uniref:type III-B CRISPR-associated protein Cas10/Cmr2 n=1 Tax=Egbenema bharatensis TaxID=3463334 RepID=UPI003A8AE99E
MAGSYLLHYLSARLCWHIAQAYGPDAVIVPSLWGQDILDAFWLKQVAEGDTDFATVLRESFQGIDEHQRTPVERFNEKVSTSLSTAGFPNVITALIPGKEKAEELGNQLAEELKKEWKTIGRKVRDHIRETVSQEAEKILEGQWEKFWNEIKDGLREDEREAPYRKDLEKWRSRRNQFDHATYPGWEWCKLWEMQLQHAWEPYWAAVPLGDPAQPLAICKNGAEENGTKFDSNWKQAQTELSQAWLEIPNSAEEVAFDQLNVGTWWGSFQQRLRVCIQTVKNTRVWQIPVAPGERSTISGQYSAVHPNLTYRKLARRGAEQDFREGAGVPEGSMRLFWLLMARAYSGLFSGSERLNALELTKRMAWIYGDAAESLGIPVSQTIKRLKTHPKLLERVQIDHVERFLYDRFVRFPNLSSIAAARFIHENSEMTRRYCSDLESAIHNQFGDRYRRIFRRIACISLGNIPKTDQQVNPDRQKRGYLNGVMFSSKWLAEDLGLDRSQTQVLRGLVERTHQKHHFGEGSPSDWWVIVLADGDGMGQYISGSKLEKYEKYLVNVDTAGFDGPIAQAYRELERTQKRMGPATHIGLNRALLDFSNRLVPYLTEKRCCGKVIYSGGDDVMAVLPLEDLPDYLRSLRAAWSGAADPFDEFDHGDGYWRRRVAPPLEGVPKRPLFTMGNTATMSMGVVIAHKSVPLPTVLENLWTAEGDRAKEMPGKDGICFRVIYGSGNVLEALMKGTLLERWWAFAQHYQKALSPVLYRLSEELPNRVDVQHPHLFAEAAKVIMARRDEDLKIKELEAPIQDWLTDWAEWANSVSQPDAEPIGATAADLGKILRFTAFWVDKRVQRQGWVKAFQTGSDPSEQPIAEGE